MLYRYLEKHIDGGQIVLLTGWSTKGPYAFMPFQIVQWPLFRTLPLDIDQWEEKMLQCPPFEKPRGSLQCLLESNMNELRIRKEGPFSTRPTESKECEGLLHGCDLLKIWVFCTKCGPTSVLCAPDDTFRGLLRCARVAFLFKRRIIMPAQEKDGWARLTADGGQTFLAEDLTLAGYGVRWGSTVELKFGVKDSPLDASAYECYAYDGSSSVAASHIL